MKCTKCGTENEKKALFCKECGTELVREKKATSKQLIKIIVGGVLAVILVFVVAVIMRKISFRKIMGSAKDVSEYYAFELDDVEKIVLEEAINTSLDYVETKQSFYNEDGVCLAEFVYNEKGYCLGVHVYNEHGNCIFNPDWLQYYSGGGIITDYEYDDDKLVRAKYYNNDGSPEYYVDYSYDKAGNIVKEKQYFGDGIAVFPGVNKYKNTYEDGELVKVYEDLGNGQKHVYTYDYDRDGNMISEEFLCASDFSHCSEVNWVKTYAYKEDALVMEVRYRMSSPGNVKSYFEDIYDPTNGLLQETRYYGEDGYLRSKYYVYDAKRDLIQVSDDNYIYQYSTEYVNSDVKIRMEEDKENAGNYYTIIELD